MISEGIASALTATLTAGLAAVAIHETAETIRSYSPNNRNKKKQSRDKTYQSLIWG